MKIVILAAIFIVLATSQVRAYAYPQLVDDDGFQIDFERTEDKPVEEVLFNYARLLLERQRKPRPPPGPPLSSYNGMAEDQTNAQCPTLDCNCNITMQLLRGFIRDENGNPTQNCTIFNVPYCEGVCESSYRYIGTTH